MTELRAHAKINWALRVTGRRADGFHDLETLFQKISLHDTLTIEPAPELSMTCSDPTISVDDRNLVIRAAQAAGLVARIHLEKRIPHGGGLGGGSSDAAAVLAHAGRRDPDVALTLGSDVPFFIHGESTAYATGRGEVLTTLPAASGVALLLVFPEERVSTARAFAMLTRFSPPLGVDRYRAMIDGDLLSHAAELVNDFEEPIFALHPHLRAIKSRLIALGAAWAGMSGSGSTIVGAFREASVRDAALTAMRGEVQCVAAQTI
jgi:4-diphosphocytidyl-2-C-methyl-D-erythritol kinase